MTNIPNIGPRGVFIRRTAGYLALGFAGVTLVQALTGRNGGGTPLGPLPVTLGFALASAVVLLEEARRRVCIVHAALGRRSREGRRLYGPLRPDERHAVRTSAAHIVREGLAMGALGAASGSLVRRQER
jgi:hypothetical protein